MGRTLKYFLKKLLGHGIFMVYFFWKICKTLCPPPPPSLSYMLNVRSLILKKLQSLFKNLIPLCLNTSAIHYLVFFVLLLLILAATKEMGIAQNRNSLLYQKLCWNKERLNNQQPLPRLCKMEFFGFSEKVFPRT